MRRRNPTIRNPLVFRPPEPELLMYDIARERQEHLEDANVVASFNLHDINAFVSYVSDAFHSIPNYLFERMHSLSASNFYTWYPSFNAGWMLDPVAMETILESPGNSPVQFLTIHVDSWQNFIHHITGISRRGRFREPPANPEIFEQANIVINESRLNYLEKNNQIIDELLATGNWEQTPQRNYGGQLYSTMLFRGPMPIDMEWYVPFDEFGHYVSGGSREP
jgi:hypothetical protein